MTLDAAAIEQRLMSRTAEYMVRHVRPVLRGRGTQQSSRRKDLGRGRPYAANNLVALLAEAICDPRHETDGICVLLDELKLDVRALRGELRDVDFHDAMVRETTAQGATDTLQYLVARHPTVGTLDALLAALHTEIDAKELAREVTKREREKLAGPR